MAGNEERTPLLAGDNSLPAVATFAESETPTAPPPPYPQQETDGSAATLPIGADELPPPYSPTPQGGVPMINCKVCQAVISLDGKQHLHVIKCQVCNEATPIRAAPPGRKYIRCPCNLLLVCRSGATKILCPRETCKRVINLAPPGAMFPAPSVGARFECAYCHQTFVLRVFCRFARCPHCRKLSGTSLSFTRTRGHTYLIIGLLFLGLATGITVGTYENAQSEGGIYVAWIGGFVVGLLMLIRAAYFYNLKTSTLLEGNGIYNP